MKDERRAEEEGVTVELRKKAQNSQELRRSRSSRRRRVAAVATVAQQEGRTEEANFSIDVGLRTLNLILYLGLENGKWEVTKCNVY